MYIDKSFTNIRTTTSMKATIWELLYQSVPAIAVALFGGIVSVINSKERISVKYALGGIFTAVLVGLILDMAMIEFQVSEKVRVIVVAMGGYCSRDVIVLFENLFLKNLKSKAKLK